MTLGRQEVSSGGQEGPSSTLAWPGLVHAHEDPTAAARCLREHRADQHARTQTRLKTHLHQLHEILEELLLVDAELALVVYDPVVLHLALAADAERVVAGVVGALAHQEQPRLRGVQQSLRLLPRDLPVEPSGSSGEREREREGEKEG